MFVTRPKLPIVMLATVALLPVGCSSLSGNKALTSKEETSSSWMDRLPWSSDQPEDAEPYPNPVKMAATWTPDTLVQPGKTPTRGFGGRLFFYDEKSRPVPVDGTLVIHGFNDQSESPDDRVKRFEFTPEQFTNHFSQSDLGASYSVWVPWDAVGGQQEKISLVASFRPAVGKPIQGIPATVVLPGHKAQLSEDEAVAKLAPQYQRYLAAQNTSQAHSSGLTTTTIQRHRIRAGGEPDSSPSITIPPHTDPAAMVAGNQPTPSMDLRMSKSPRSTMIQAASAQMPIQR